MAGNKQQFTLQFNADIAQAKRAIQDLNNSLKKVSEASINDFGISRELEEASNAAKELRTHIAAATNASTGKLNLNEFNASIKMSESNLSSLLSKLASGGAAGQAAFMSFANAVAQSEAPLKRVNATLSNMVTTLKNTLTWELSSTVVHGLESSLSGAVSYVKDLNTSLTNIRIVTGQSTNDMAKFALEANKAAKELSTTTKSYADASLIYYQQGDNAEQAAKKAAITIKAANSSFNTSAAEMSEYLTAVWNSYQAGADELERYVDIMAALGAKTATSLEEIATSMQKVAATGHAVGISMEQVSSIIATVSSVTRESAESIGTSYKTIFARIGDLKLGGTTEDGIGLGQVSSQLDSIGVQILDTSGNLRDMGDIITDLGNKWQTMSEAQKVATAQVVAGKRQYTQLMALFENWDMYNQNMNIASNADGALQEMADVYAESWEAASAKVKASMESLYSSLINDEAIIKFTNFISQIVDGISSFVTTLGGAKGVIKTFGAIGLMVFQKQISNSITTTIQNIQKFFATKGQVSEYVSNLSRIKSTLMSLKTTSDQAGTTTEIDNSIKLLELKESLALKEKDLTDTQKAAAQAMISSMSEEINMVNQLGESYDSMDQKIQEMIASMAQADLREMDLLKNNKPGQTIFQADKQGYKELTDAFFSNTNLTQVNSQAMSQLLKTLGANTISGLTNKYASAVQDTAAIDAAIERIQQIKTSGEAAETQAKELGLAFDFIEQYAQKATPETMNLFNQLKINMTTMPVAQLTAEMNKLKAAIVLDTYGVSSYEQLRQKLTSLGLIVPENASKFDLLEMAAKKAGLSFYQLDTKTRTLESSFSSLQNKINNLGTSLNKNLGTIQMATSALMSLSASFSASSNAAKNWDDGGIADKIGSVVATLTNIVSLVGQGVAIGSKIAPGKGTVIGAAIGLVAGLATSIFGIFSGNKEKDAEEAAEKLAEIAQESKQYLNDLAEQENTIAGLATSYGELRDQMDIDYAGYADSVLALTSELLQQDTTVQGLITRYGSLEQAVIKARKEYLTGVRDEGKEAISDQVATVDGEGFYAAEAGDTVYVRDETGVSSSDQQIEYNNLIQQAATKYFRNNQSSDSSAFYSALMAYNAEYGTPTQFGYWNGNDDLLVQGMYQQNHFGQEAPDLQTAYDWFNQEFSEMLGNALTTTQDMLSQGSTTEDKFFDTYGQQILQESLNKGGDFDFTNPNNQFIQEKIGLYVTNLATQMGFNTGWSPMAAASIFYDQRRDDNWYNEDDGSLNLERYNDSQYQDYFTGWTEEDPIQRLLSLVNTEIVGGLGNQHFVTMANEQTMPEDLALLSRAVQGDILTAEEALRVSTEGLAIMEKYGIVSQDMAEFITNFGNRETSEGDSLKDLSTSTGAQIVSDAELELSVIDEYGLKGYNLNKDSSTDYFNYINNMAQDLMEQGVPAFEAMDKALAFAANWGITSNFTDDYNTLTDIAETIAQTSGADPFEILEAIIQTYLNYGENFKYLNFHGATYNSDTGTIQFQGNQDQMIAFSNAQSNLTTAQTQEATIKELAAMSPDELLSMSTTDFNRYQNDINWSQSIPGFEDVTSIEDWAQLNTTRRQEYLDAILQNTQDSIYGENGYLQTSINAANTWADSLDQLYHEQMGHIQNEDGSYQMDDSGSYIVGNVETLYAQAVAANNKMRGAMEIFDGTTDLSFVDDWYNLQEDEIERLNGYGEVLEAAGIDLEGQSAAEYIAGFKTNSGSAARTWYNANRQKYMTKETYIGYIDSIPGQITSINAQGQTLTNQRTQFNTFGGMTTEEDATTQFKNQTREIEIAIDQAEDYANVLNNLNLDSIFSLGTKEWERLTKIIGKTKSEFLAMSKIEQIELIGQSQIDQLNTASQKYSEMADEAKTQRDKFTKGSEEWLEWEERRLSYEQQASNTAIEAEQVNADTLSQKVEVWESAFANAEARVADLRKQTEELQDKANVLSKAIFSGELSAQDKAKLSQEDLDAWNQAGSAAERAAIATRAWSNYATKVATDGEELTTIYGKAADALKHTFIDDDKYSNLADKNKYLDYMKKTRNADDETLGAISKAWDNLIAKGVKLTEMNNHDITEALKTELIAMNIDVTDATILAASMSKDAILEIYAGLGEQEQALAAEFVAIWEQAFKTVASLRSKILMGEDIMGDLTSSFESFNQIASSYKGGADALVSDFKAGKVVVDNLDFGTPEDYTAALKRERGAEFFTESGFNRYRAAEKLGIKRENFGNNEDFLDAAEKAMRPYLETLLEGYDLTETGFDTIDELINSYFENGYGSEAWKILNAAAQKVYDNADRYADLVYAEEGMLEEKQKRDKTIEEANEGMEQANAYATAADEALSYNRGEDTSVTQSLIDSGINLVDFAEMANKVLQRDDLTAENLDQLTDKDLNAIYNSQVQAGQEFHDIVVSAANDFLALFSGDGKFSEYAGSEFGQEALETATDAQKDVDNFNTESEAERIRRQEDYESNLASEAGFDNPDQFKTYAEYLNSAMDAQDRFNTSTEEGKNALYEYAKAVAMAADGFEDLQSITDDTWKSLKDSSNKGSKDWIKDIESLRKTTSKVFNTDMKYITAEFVESHLDQLEKMANGTEEEALAAQDAIQDDLVAAVMQADGTSATILINAETGEAESALTYLQNALDQWDGEEIGFTIHAETQGAEANVIASLQGMLDAGIMTADQIAGALNAIGWEPKITWQDVTMVNEDQETGMVTVKDSEGNTYTVKSTNVMRTENGLKIPVIGSAKKISVPGGGPRRSSGGGGGGGGGGGSKPKKLDKKEPEDSKERYHETNQTLDRLADELEKVDKLKTRAYGKNHLNAIKQEIGLLKQEISLQQDYVKQAQDYLKIDRERVASLGATFNEDGIISNYDELIDSIVAKYNDFIDKYNASSASAQEGMEEDKEEMDKWFDKAMEWISQYEETLNITRDKENEIIELQNEISAKTLEGIQYKVEIEVELNDAETEFLDYLNEKYSETLKKQGMLVENLIREQQLAQENLAVLNTAKTELDEKYANGELTQADYIEGLKDINNQILDNLSALEELRKEIQEAYGNALDLVTEKIDNHTEKIENASSAMESYISIMRLLGQNIDYEKINEFYKQQYEYNLASLETQQQYLDALKEEEAYYLAKMARGELTETEREQFEALQDTIASVQDEILSKTEETLSALKEAFSSMISGILKDFEESIAGAGNSLEDLAADYEYYLEVQERNVSTSKELYEISKLNRQIEQDIADTSSSVYKQRLAALQEEIKAKSADRALTEYDIQMMNLEYELLQRQMALEEAKSAKDTVRLTRDSSGNYIYQYTANQDAINEAQQGVEDVLQRMAEANAERVGQLEQETINTYQNMVAQIEEIANSEVLTQEEKNARIAEIVARTQEKMNWIQQQYTIATENTTLTYERIQDQYGKNMADAAQMTKDSMNGTIGEIINKTNEFSLNMQNVQETVAEQLKLLQSNMDAVLTTTKWDEAAGSIKDYNAVIEDAQQDAQKMIATLGGENGLLTNIRTTTAAWDLQSKTIENLITYYEQLYKSILKIQETESTKTPATPADIPTPSTPPDTETPPVVTTDSADEQVNTNQVQYQGGSWQFYTYDAPSGGKKGAIFHGNNKSPIVTKEDESGNRIKISGVDGDGHSFVGRWISKVYKNKELWKAYAMGGLVDYTGPAWVDGTKDRPELMLNASDTENMLTAVQTVRSLDTATLTLLDDFIKLATSSMLSANSLHATGVHNANQELQQQVHITAEFPNVQDSNEIQDAFDNLINRAAQFVGSIKK